MLIFVGVSVIILWFAVLNPKQSVSQGAEAIVVFAGGKGERFDLALELVKKYEIKRMFLSIGAVHWKDQNRLLEYCSKKHIELVTTCVTTNIDTDNTLGEAKLFAEEANKLGINHLVAVSGKSHVFRANLRLSQNFDGVVDRIGAPENLTIKAVVHEWLGIIHATLVR